ncbi:MAG: hypothetical protein E6J87_20510 [Deltaproteobacteria bacterium]|nr:MAG: hypothetical protein E6J87_20510 [Deltaproteobacteria bacterium]
MRIRSLTVVWALFALLSISTGRAWAQAVCPDEEALSQMLINERAAVISEVAPPAPGTVLHPVQRIPRDHFGLVGNPPLTASDLGALVYPNADSSERASLLEGLTFFTAEQTAATGRGGPSNQPNCLGCHTNSGEAVSGLVDTVSPASRAARSSPTNFEFTGQGRAADDNDAIGNTGRTAAFTIFGDTCARSAGDPPCQGPAPINPGAFDALARAGLFGTVQHTRPSLISCPADPIPSFSIDSNLAGLDPADGWMNDWRASSGFRRTVAERAAPPYIGRGLIEAVPNADILALADPNDDQGEQVGVNATNPNPFGDATPRMGRFGLRAQGPQLVVFIAVGGQEEVGATSLVRPAENDFSTATARPECFDGRPEPDICLSTVVSTRSLIRMVAPPEFGDTLSQLLQLPDPSAPQRPNSRAEIVQRGAKLFGVVLVAFANRMVPGRFPEGGDGRNPHAINDDPSSTRCASCHTPVQRTGTSPANVGARHLSNVWAPMFADLLLHDMPVVNAERIAPTPRNPLSVLRLGSNSFDLSRNFGEDALPNQGIAQAAEFRTTPLMGLGVIGAPFLHDGRVYLSTDTARTAPASTVTANRRSANLPLVVRTADDALLAATELHDLPAPRPGCPVPPAGSDGLVRVGDVVYGTVEQATDDICPPLDSPRRGESRESIRRFRNLTRADQRAVIEFMKEL